jgi:hypothetical protein
VSTECVHREEPTIRGNTSRSTLEEEDSISTERERVIGCDGEFDVRYNVTSIVGNCVSVAEESNFVQIGYDVDIQEATIIPDGYYPMPFINPVYLE